MIAEQSERPVRQQRLVVMVSGNGSNLQAILDACADGRSTAAWWRLCRTRQTSSRCSVRTSRSARRAHRHAYWRDRAHYDARLTELVAGFDPDFIVLAGWAPHSHHELPGLVPGRVVNLQPGQARRVARAERDRAGVGRGRSWHAHRVGRDGLTSCPMKASTTARCSRPRQYRSTRLAPSKTSRPRYMPSSTGYSSA